MHLVHVDTVLTNCVADFVGESNIFHGMVSEPGVVTLEGGRRLSVGRSGRGGEGAGTKVGVLMRPERFDAGDNRFSGTVKEAVYLGVSFKLRLACDDGFELIVRQPARGELPAVGTRGTVGRNTIEGPGLITFDPAFVKSFSMGQSTKRTAQLRIEAFNLFNKVGPGVSQQINGFGAVGAPNTVFTNMLFGRITTAADPRIMQFALKFLF